MLKVATLTPVQASDDMDTEEDGEDEGVDDEGSFADVDDLEGREIFIIKLLLLTYR
jgi:hypothetical protein